MNPSMSLLVILVALMSCSSPTAHRIEAQNLTVFFEKKKDFELAKKFAHYWKDEGFVASKHQYLKLTRSANQLTLHLIASQAKRDVPTSFERRQQFLVLQHKLDSLFENKFQTAIVICDANFQILEHIN